MGAKTKSRSKHEHEGCVRFDFLRGPPQLVYLTVLIVRRLLLFLSLLHSRFKILLLLLLRLLSPVPPLSPRALVNPFAVSTIHLTHPVHRMSLASPTATTPGTSAAASYNQNDWHRWSRSMIC